MIFEKTLINALQAVEGAFTPDELAYLALTQKVEHVIRDKLAFVLHKSLQVISRNYLVCREWKRADLAIIQDEIPLLILEAKAGYSFDIMRKERGYDFPALIASDLEKAVKLSSRFDTTSPEVYALVIATHPHHAPEKKYSSAVKYYANVARYANNNNNIDTMKIIMNERMNKFSLVESQAIKGGRAFGVEVSVYLWLYRAGTDTVNMLAA